MSLAIMLALSFSSSRVLGEGDRRRRWRGSLAPPRTPPPCYAWSSSPANAGEESGLVDRPAHHVDQHLQRLDPDGPAANRSEMPFLDPGFAVPAGAGHEDEAFLMLLIGWS